LSGVGSPYVSLCFFTPTSITCQSHHCSGCIQSPSAYPTPSLCNLETSRPTMLSLEDPVYLWRKVVCFVVMRSTELGCFRSCSWCLWKALDKEGCMGLVPWCLDLRCKSSWILNGFFTEN
jgi:hypothetical protein